MQTPRFVRKLQRSLRSVPMALGIDMYKQTEDRRVLEKEVFPYFISSSEYSKVLFVGCAWYTRGYNTIFKGKDFQTLEIDPSEAKHGARKHITDSLENINYHFDEDELDLIICNGVFGWGLDEKANVEAAFQGCFRCLRQGGILVLGWNDLPERRPISLDECRSLKLFQPFVFPPLSTAQYHTTTSNNHTYSFFIKRT